MRNFIFIAKEGYTYNQDNQLLEISDGTGYTYDQNGNTITRTKSGDTTTYEYDYENRLVGITFPDLSTARYLYCTCPPELCGLGGCSTEYNGGCGTSASTDVGGRRYAKITPEGTTYYFYDAADIIMEFNQDGVLLARYTHGPGIDAPISMTRGEETFYYLTDHQGSVIALADASGVTIPFCYLCYTDAPQGRCVRCGTDDLMRHLPGVGVEYGYEWVLEHLIRQEVEDISEEDQENLFMDFIDDCYNEETKIAFLTVNTAWAVKQLDPLAFEMALHEYFDVEAHVEIDGRLYSISAIEIWAEESTKKFENCDMVMEVKP